MRKEYKALFLLALICFQNVAVHAQVGSGDDDESSSKTEPETTGDAPSTPKVVDGFTEDE
jgi:hypothetical protein